jgi:ABC-type multidrug transport system fused ATPase/permease subunit
VESVRITDQAVVARVTSDTVLLSEAAASSLVGIINSVVMLVGTLVLMGVLDLVLLGATVAAVIVVTVLFLLVMPAIAKAKEQAQEHLGQLGGVLEGALRALKTVKANRAEDRIEHQIVASAATSAEYSIRAALAWTIAWTGVQLAIIAVLAIGAGAMPRCASGSRTSSRRRRSCPARSSTTCGSVDRTPRARRSRPRRCGSIRARTGSWSAPRSRPR